MSAKDLSIYYQEKLIKCLGDGFGPGYLVNEMLYHGNTNELDKLYEEDVIWQTPPEILGIGLVPTNKVQGSLILLTFLGKYEKFWSSDALIEIWGVDFAKRSTSEPMEGYIVGAVKFVNDIGYEKGDIFKIDLGGVDPAVFIVFDKEWAVSVAPFYKVDRLADAKSELKSLASRMLGFPYIEN